MDQALRNALLLLAPEYAARVASLAKAEDIRLRRGNIPGYTVGGREYALAGAPAVTEKAMLYTLERASAASLYAVQESLRRGYIHAFGGIRVGVCGTGVYRDGALSTIKDISSVSIRIARQCPGIADGLVPPKGTVPESTLLIGPPGSGKTSLLREMIRRISDGGVRVSVCDTRGEIAAMHAGVSGFVVGQCTDVLEGVEPREAVMMLLRTMTPQVVALDEISEGEDARAVELAANNGAAILATVHGASCGDVFARPVLARLLRRGIFRRAIVIRVEGGTRRYTCMELSGEAYAA